MSTENRSNRYQKIYGAQMRASQAQYFEYGQTARKIEPVEPLRRTKTKEQREEERRQKELARGAGFDWKYTAFVTTCALIVTICAFFYVTETVRVNNLSTKVTQLKNEKTILKSKQVALKTEINKKINIDEIRTYAEQELHMTYADSKNTIYYQSGTDDYFLQYDSVEAADH